MTTPPEPDRQPEAPARQPEMLDRQPEILELYKLAVEMADRVSARRGTANAFFLSVQSALVTLVAFGSPNLSQSPWWVPLAVALAGITLSGAWWMQLRSYRDLNGAKFQVIHKLEDHLAARLMADEWDILKRDPLPGLRTRYAELGTSERIVPVVFAMAHLILFGGTLSV
ncbi:hypothetical protein AB5J72_23630 [Streptomyces sp. CG1]|uniref:RipA family octameric membrane protein n=1 Tax=Streptomyces sp. CG1 TaxID=1287523 RepID=UPI0034E2CDB6